jgi:glutamate N-acetyltransferase / amino-acid N-acetyltransferase
VTSGVTAVPGFDAGGLACGIKASGDPDLALLATSDRAPATAAGVFTTNLAQAAPVQISCRHLGDARAAAVVLSSGNANAATGAPGRRDASRMCELVGEGIGVDPADVLVCSTGLIGIPMPMDALEAGIPKLCGQIAPDGGGRAARAMMTTDTKPKEAVARAGAATVGGMAKGAAMLSPAMATMLAVVTTDAAVEGPALQRALARAVADTFDCLSVDGCRSTNDTVLVLANGLAGAVDAVALTDAITAVCGSLAEQMARDAEGASKFVRVRVVGARSTAEARIAARAVANSQLVQCSLNGNDPYWGRVLSELGASGAHLDPEAVDISYNGVTVCRDGIASAHDEAALAHALVQTDIEILCDLRQAHGEATVLTTDLSHAYIDENRRTS